MNRNRTKPTTNSISCLLAATLLAFGTSSCAGELDVLDDAAAHGGTGGEGTGSTGMGGTNTTLSSGSGGPSTNTTGGTAGAGGSLEPCENQICEPDPYCFAPPGAATESVCPPTCGSEREFVGEPCPRSVTGEEGICVPFSYYEPSEEYSMTLNLCSVTCDPLAPDCPESFACTITEGDHGPVGEAVPLVFACLPLLQPRPVGTQCPGQALGECEPGSECIGESTALYFCRAFCDTREDDACPEPQTCQRPYWFPEGSPVGYCAE